MRRSIERLSAIATVTARAVVGCSGTGDGSEDTTTTTAMVVQPIADGDWFALVTVGTDESEEMTLGVDPADILVLELLEVTDDVRFISISGSNTSERIAVDADTMAVLWDGSYEGDPIYGIVPGNPIALNVTVTDGLVSQAEAVYLP